MVGFDFIVKKIHSEIFIFYFEEVALKVASAVVVFFENHMYNFILKFHDFLYLIL